jgi:hypothetical protein
MERIPCDPDFVDTDRCSVYRKIGRCFMDKHHIFHPKADYAPGLETRFRNLPENVNDECRMLHNLEHAVFPPPDKPDLDIMRMAVTEEKNKRRQL